ncbi:site-2 protease family protein [Clostridium oryzae]|uniref:Peptidase family M50 n=1 Tax=Clostridium oryzae TaxID=1450648 RepID=A0A1V4I3I3_9CLOT|nr:site-2 protease family protein [Clostridium oryzae]OPJ54536.1 peptidase family M50 [Clostridium oryzae]
MREQLINIVLIIPAMLIAFTFHEYAHAFIAYKLGDKSQKFQGRLTFNPIAHIDLIGLLMILVFKFGWAKPVQVNRSSFKHYYKDDLKVSIAGPLANLVIAFIFTPILWLYINKFMPSISNQDLNGILLKIIYQVIDLNVMFFILNLIPIPGFDGYNILADIFPKAFSKIPYNVQNYGLFIAIVIFSLPIFRQIFGLAVQFIESGLFTIFNLGYLIGM